MALRLASLAALGLALAACGSSDIDADAILANIQREIERDKAANRAAAVNSAAPAIERAALIGRWSDAPGCQDVITEFRDDGRFSAGPVSGTWVLDGARLTVTANRRARSLTVEAVDSTDLFMTAESGERLRSYRCTSPER